MMIMGSASLHLAYVAGMGYVMPVLSVVCLLVGLARARRLRPWILGAAAVPVAAWAALATWLCIGVPGPFTQIDIVVAAWTTVGLIVLLVAIWSLCRGKVYAWWLSLVALGIPVPVMCFLLLMSVLYDVSRM